MYANNLAKNTLPESSNTNYVYKYGSGIPSLKNKKGNKLNTINHIYQPVLLF